MSPFGSAANLYVERGWRPFPVEGKFPPVRGVTGRDGVVTAEKIEDWLGSHAHWNLALRAEGYVAIDVDHYGDKHGADTLAEYEVRLGRLPATWRSSARGADNPSGQRFFRIAEGDKPLVGKIGSDIEVVQFHHRYSVVWPSIHPSGLLYEWISPAGDGGQPVPNLEWDIPDLPQAWVDELSREPHADLADGVTVIAWRQLVESFNTGEPCLAVMSYMNDVIGVDHMGHDEAFRFALRGFMLGREGHTGVAAVITDEVWSPFVKYIGEHSDRDPKEPAQVFTAANDTAQRKVVTDVCRCPQAGELSDADLVGVVDPDLAIKLNSPMITWMQGRPKIDLEVGAARFCYEHPVRRHANSNGATYMWTGERWTTADVYEFVYRWLTRMLTSDEFSGSKAKELTEHILIHAPSVTDRDIDRNYLSVKNGLLDWRTGELRPRTKDVFVVNHIPHNWRPEATPGRFNEWLASAIDPAARTAVAEVLGYAVSPVHDMKVALALTGPGGGGKSTFVNMVMNLVGMENCSSLAPNDLGERFNPAELFNKTVNAAGDVGAETLKNLGRFKMIVAGDEIQAERKGRDPFRFRPRAFSIASFNVLPAVEQNDSAFWDRWLVLPFAQRFNTGRPDNYFRDVMPYDQAVMEGALVMAVRGLQNLRSRGRFDPDVFTPAKDEWRAQVDGIAAFVQDHIVVDSSGVVDGQQLFLHYQNTALQNGQHPKSQPNFYRDFLAYMTERFGRRVFKSKRSPYKFVGVRVVDGSDNAPGIWGDKGYTRPFPG